ncbi:MAG: VWA domain-containing protein [Chloroflexota bacterium]
MHRTRLPLLALAVALLVPASALAQDGPIEPVPPCQLDCWWPAGSVAELDALKASVDVHDGAIVAHYRFRLSNPVAATDVAAPAAEGRIVFPVPAGSSVTDLVLSGGPDTLEGKMLGADDASRIYEDIVRRLVDPALLRSLDGNLYEVRAFPVPAGEERAVSFTVTTPLLAEGDQALVTVPWSGMSPRPLAATVDVDVDVPWEVRTALAPGFDLQQQRTGPGAIGLAWESPAGWSATDDLQLYLGGGSGLVDTRLLAYREGEEDGTFALLFAPVVETDRDVPRDIVLVLDTSGSMDGDKLAQAKDAAAYLLDHLGAHDRFAVVDFARFVETWKDELRPASEAADAATYVADLQAGGDTNISGALTRAFGLLTGDRPGTVIFLTDGLPTSGIEDTDGIVQAAIAAAPPRTQLFAFGVGYDVDPVLLDSLSTQFVGSSHYVTPEERIDLEVQKLYERVSTPVLTDLTVKIDGVKTRDVAPRGITGLFAGNQALLTGRYVGSGPATITVSGNSADGPVTFTYDVDFPDHDTSDPTISQLWAQRRVADLLTEVRTEGTRDDLIAEIVDLASRFGIVTPYTSYLAQEPDQAFAPEAARQSVNDAVQAAPVSGEGAVAGASDLETLRDGRMTLGTTGSRVVGDHTYYLVDGTWTRDGFPADTVAPEVAVGSDAFRALLAADPGVAAAAALGARVIVEGPDGWVTLVWPATAAPAG